MSRLNFILLLLLQLSLDILNEHSEKLEPSVLASSYQPEIGISPVRLPDIELFQIDPRMANARRHIAVFTYLIDSCEEERYALDGLLITLYLLVSSADNFCKQFGPR